LILYIVFIVLKLLKLQVSIYIISCT